MHPRYFLTLLVMMTFSTGMNEHGGAFDHHTGLFSADGNSSVIAQSIYKDNSEDEEKSSGKTKGGKKSGSDTDSVRNVKPRPSVKDREKVKDRAPAKRP